MHRVGCDGPCLAARHRWGYGARPVRRSRPRKPLLNTTCPVAEAAVAATVLVAAVVGTVAAPPLSTMAGPHALSKGPGQPIT